ncbi:FAD-dependent oxidoreductase [Paenibacillus senegalensis]|uniref:FAD-dependent oxidoreductase n=1 Tax=Paenibacillus senegalensis TaxID=1465766 RepID=UPI0005A80084|nr:FAD-dependent oxidoreductase [Paenibacillus senegalensis]
MRAATRKKREFVLDTALQLFVEKGYDQVSVDDIIAQTGTSKGTFYHYFDSKEDILQEINRKQLDIMRQWAETTPAHVFSVEGHINQLFLDLASNLDPYRKVVRHLSTHSMQKEGQSSSMEEPASSLEQYLQLWLPDANKARLLASVYSGTIMHWCIRQDEDLISLMSSNLRLVWPGLRSDSTSPELQIAAEPKEEPKMRVAIIGGGLAGLTAAAYLSECEHIEGVLFERSPQLGGRAFTYEKSGFTLNYGAHAVYGIDRHTLSDMEKELGLSFSSKQVDKRKVLYSKNGQTSKAPLDFANLVSTDLLSPLQKMRFVGEITAIMANIHQLKNYRTLGDYLADFSADDDVKELWEHLVCSNFFIAPEDARKVPGPVISEYYHNLFLSSRPVNYILGSWAVITNQLKQKADNSRRWAFQLQEAVESIRYENKRYVLTTKKGEEAFDEVIFAMPIQQVVKLLKDTAWEPFLADYENNTPTEVLVYDIGFDEVVARPFSYISDMDNKMFISDVSATDHTVVPQGGQLLQGIAYLTDEIGDEEDRKKYLDEKMKQMEALFERYYPGWQEKKVVKRASKKAMVSSVKNIAGNKLMPNRVENMPFYFCGDGCTGKGELAERAFSSARNVARMLVKKADSSLVAST